MGLHLFQRGKGRERKERRLRREESNCFLCVGYLWWPHPSLMTSQWGGSQNHCWLMIAGWLWNYAASRACRRIPLSIHLPFSRMSTGPQLQDPALTFRPHSWWFCPVRHLSRFPSIWPGLGFAREVGVVFVLQNHSYPWEIRPMRLYPCCSLISLIYEKFQLLLPL